MNGGTSRLGMAATLKLALVGAMIAVALPQSGAAVPDGAHATWPWAPGTIGAVGLLLLVAGALIEFRGERTRAFTNHRPGAGSRCPHRAWD
jgi:protein-S-isoprenylcysteine O-methyltransferase Ste14